MRNRSRDALARSSLLVSMLTLLAACAGNAPQAVTDPATTPVTPVSNLTIANPLALHEVIDQRVDAGGYPFIYARLEDAAGRVLYERSSVNRALIGDAEIDGQTWIRIWSMSKIVTIALVMDLVEEELISLDDPVTDYIPEFAALQVATAADGSELGYFDGEPPPCPLIMTPVSTTMTLADLVNHEAGFYYALTGIPCLDEPLAAANLPTAADSDELIDKLAALPLIQQPGNDYYYGTNTTVLGLVAERATGDSLKTLIEERLTGPLQISGLQYGLPEGETLLPSISGSDGTLRPARDGELDIFGPDVPDYDPLHRLYLGGEGMLATADGYTDFLRMLLRRGELNGYRLLNDTTIAEMTAPHTMVDSDSGYNGYNLWVNTEPRADGSVPRNGLWTGGGYEGTHFWIDPEYGFVAVVMSQIHDVPEVGSNRNEAFRNAVYEQLRGVAR